jgi:predicted methyltransferase
LPADSTIFDGEGPVMRGESTKAIAALLLSAVLLGCSESEDPASATPDNPVDKLRIALNAESRPLADRRRDSDRKPAEVIEFLGIEPGMSAIDLIAGAGYYTEVLSLAVSPDGSVTAMNPPSVMESNSGIIARSLEARLAGGRLPNVSRLDKELGEIRASDGPYDAALTALNLHDIYNSTGRQGVENFLRIAYTLLRPGGVLGVIDHAGSTGAAVTSLHRIDKAIVYEAASRAGLVVEEESDLLVNTQDDRSLAVFDEQVRGRSDRFLLRLRKPLEAPSREN